MRITLFDFQLKHLLGAREARLAFDGRETAPSKNASVLFLNLRIFVLQEGSRESEEILFEKPQVTPEANCPTSNQPSAYSPIAGLLLSDSNLVGVSHFPHIHYQVVARVVTR